MWQEMPHWIPAQVAGEAIGEVASNLTQITPASEILGSAKGKPEGNREEAAGKDNHRDSNGLGVAEM